MESGIFPREDKSLQELEEERRLFYVGITRAQDELYLTSCSCRRLYGSLRHMYPSPFLSEIDRSCIRVIGDVPSSFKSGAVMLNEDPIVKKYPVGACIYHDDYGQGRIVKAAMSDDGEYVITVAFETGGEKKFLPKYQQKKLLVQKGELTGSAREIVQKAKEKKAEKAAVKAEKKAKK
jgi:DNA helicase-2/ATP-dependent DNA helicase PcrA